MGIMGGGKGGGKHTMASKPNLLSALRVQTSAYGQVLPILYGQNRIAGRLIWSGDFTAVPHTSTTRTGGKGGGGGQTVTETTYTYTTAVAMALCAGPVQNIYNVWTTKGKLGLVSATVPFTIPQSGGSFTVPLPPGAQYYTTPSNYSDYGVARTDSFSGSVNDYGSDGSIPHNGVMQTRMTRVTGALAAGQYSISGSTYTFSNADSNKTVIINYVYSSPDSTGGAGQPAARLNLTLIPGQRPQLPWGYLTSTHPGQDLGYTGVAYVVTPALDLGESDSLPNLSYEVLGLLPFGAGITDAEPSSIISDLINNPFYGMNGAVPLETAVLLPQYQSYCMANGIFLSPVLDAQKSGAEWIQEILDVTNSAAVWSEGLLKIVTYGDTTASGNGATFSPTNRPRYDLTANDLLDEVKIKRPAVADVMNSVSVEFVNRANDYNVEIAEDKDDAMIALYGLRKAEPRHYHSITTPGVAKQVANFIRKREVEIRATYTIKLGWQFALLEPMDLVTLTIPELGYNLKPVRITAIRETEAGELEIDAEDFPWGTASPTQYPQQAPTAFSPKLNADPGMVNTPIVFEAPYQLSQSGQHELWIAVSGGMIVNLLKYSEQFDNAAWGSTAAGVAVPTVTPNTALDPYGSMTADTISCPACGSGQWSLMTQAFSSLNAVAGKPFVFSIYLKAPTPCTVTLILEDQGGNVAQSGGFQNFNVTTSWQRFSVSGTYAASGLVGAPAVYVGLDGVFPATTFYAWGAQVEQSTTLSNYAASTTGPGMLGNPNWGGCSVWVSQDNTEYTQVGKIYAPARMGVLYGAAASRQNLLLNSNVFNAAGWGVDPRVTLVQGNAQGPDGLPNSASTLSRSTAACGHASDLQQAITANANATPWTVSVWARATSGTQSIQLILNDLTTTDLVGPVLTVTPAWQRFSFSCAAGALVNSGSMLCGILLPPGSSAVSTASVQIYGAQLEQTSAMTAYIPTTTAAASCTALVNGTVDPDATNYFPVDLTQSAGTLQNGSQADADSYRTLCYVGGEFIAYQGAHLATSNRYNVGQDGQGNVYLRRGLFGTNIATHNAGEPFVRLDNAIFTYAYDPAFIGKPIYLKFTSFNTNGMVEQSVASIANPYQFIVVGTYLENESISKELLDNPSLEANTVLTPVNTVIPLGQRLSDGWTVGDGVAVGYASGVGLHNVQLEDNIVPHSGRRNFLIRLLSGVTLQPDSKWHATLVRSDYIEVKPGEAYTWGGYVRTDANATLPANIVPVVAVRAALYDVNHNFLVELNPFGVPTVKTRGELTSITGAWSQVDSEGIIPSTASGKTPAYMAVYAIAYINNQTTTAFGTGTLFYCEARYDDLYCYPQWSLANNDVSKVGSLSIAYTGGLSYTSTTSSITWSWNINVSRTNLALTVNNYTGSQAITGLPTSSNGTTFNHYPFIDEINGVVTMVSTGGIGSPSWSHSGVNVAWTQEQARSDHFPLSGAPLGASTVGTSAPPGSTGGGTGGGTGGTCLRHDVLVREKNKGVLPVSQLQVGDWVHCPVEDDTPDGWAEVAQVEKQHTHQEWVHTHFNVGDWLATTPGHPFRLQDGSMKRAALLCLEDEVPCTTGITYPVRHSLEQYTAEKITVTLRSHSHVFYAGMNAPVILQHNFVLPC